MKQSLSMEISNTKARNITLKARNAIYKPPNNNMKQRETYVKDIFSKRKWQKFSALLWKKNIEKSKIALQGINLEK